MTEARTTLREYEGDLIVEAAEIVADDVVALTLVDADGDTLPPWTPGAHVDLMLGEDLIRQYSLCSAPSDSRTIRVGGAAQPGQPRRFAVHPREADAPAATRARARAAQPLPAGRRAALPVHRRRHRDHPAAADAGRGHARPAPSGDSCTAAGRRASMAFLDELAQYGDRVTLAPQDEVGLLDLDGLLGRAATTRPWSTAAGRRRCSRPSSSAARRWPAGALHLERFAAKAAEAPAEGERSFELTLARTGVTVTVPPDRSVFDVVQEAGVSVLGLVPRGHLRHLRADRPRRRGRPPRLDPQRGRAGGERHDDDLRLALPLRPPDPRPLSKEPHHDPTSEDPLRRDRGERADGLLVRRRAPATASARELAADARRRTVRSCCSGPRTARLRRWRTAARTGRTRSARARWTATSCAAGCAGSSTTRPGSASACPPSPACRSAPPFAPTPCTRSTVWCGSGSASRDGPRCTGSRPCRGSTRDDWVSVSGRAGGRRRLPAAARELRRRHEDSGPRAGDLAGGAAVRAAAAGRRRHRDHGLAQHGSSRRACCRTGRPGRSGVDPESKFDHRQEGHFHSPPRGSTTGTSTSVRRRDRAHAVHPPRHPDRRAVAAGCTGTSAGTSRSTTAATSDGSPRCSRLLRPAGRTRWRSRSRSPTWTAHGPR